MAQTVEELALRYAVLKDDPTNYFLGGIKSEILFELKEIEETIIALVGVGGFFTATDHARKILDMVNHFPA